MDFFNLSRDRKYGYRLESNYVKEWLSYLNAVGKHPSAHQISTKYSEFKKEREQQKEQLKEQKLFNPIKTVEKFSLAGQQEGYDVIYRRLCCSSHNNLREVYRRAIHCEETIDYAILQRKVTQNSVSICLQEAICTLHTVFNW